MIFDNTTLVNKEARAALHLPANAVVSKASLWIDGEEREAAYGATAHVRSVYRRIVNRRMDPLLVTMIGPDQVQVQCFPVPANGKMKIRVGITCPLLEGHKVQVPSFIETNFGIDDNFEHSLWMEAPTPGRAYVGGSAADNEGMILTVTHEQLSRPDTYFTFDIDSPSVYRYADDAFMLGPTAWTENPVPPVLLIDGRDDVFSELRGFAWGAHRFSDVIVARPFGYEVWDGDEDVEQFLFDIATYGGVNPCPALLESIRTATDKGTSVVWLHGSLPATVREELGLEQMLRRSDTSVKIVTVAVAGELNSLISDLGYMRYFSPYPRCGDLKQDITGAVATASRIYQTADNQVLLGGRSTSGLVFTGTTDLTVTHPYRLFLYSRIMQDWFDDGEVSNDLMTRALTTRIVTPVTGAVVLENHDQYKAADLDPSVGAENIPKIPEPEFYILLGISILGAGLYMWRRKAVPCRLSR
jgi:hypothetical protein